MDLDIASLAVLAGLSVFVGALIGGVGIGGILLVPILTYVLGLDVHLAIAAAMLSYLFSGIVGAIIYTKKGTIRWSMALWIFLSAAPAAYFGAFATSITPAKGLEFIIACLVLFAGLNALITHGKKELRTEPLSPAALLGCGAATGVGSAMSGTGGPLVLVPLLVWLRVPALVAVGLAQVVQIPISILATAGNYMYGTIDIVISSVIGLGLIAGVNIGARLAHMVSQAFLQKVVALVLVAVGIFIMTRVLIPLLS